MPRPSRSSSVRHGASQDSPRRRRVPGLPTGAAGHEDGMLLLFGLHTSARVLATAQRLCRRCGNRAPHQIVEATRRFTFFFIPVFRVGSARYVDACTVCGLETELTKAEALS